VKLSTILIAALGFLSLPAPAPAQEDPKHVADEIVHHIRDLQHEDGTYGSGLADTCRVLDLLGRSPRRYTELDGPFFRRAAQQVADGKDGEVPDALLALGLAATITPPLQAKRDAALARLRTQAPGTDYDHWLALRTFPGDATVAPVALDPEADAGLACLAAEDPASVPAPAVTEVAAWTHWARAARLRHITPEAHPPLPAVNAAAGLPELMSTLETCIQMHGLFTPAVFRVDDDDTGSNAAPVPGIVPPGRAPAVALADARTFFDRHQRKGTFSLEIEGWDDPEPGVTALCLSAVAALADATQQPRPEWFAQGLDFLVSRQRSDGSIQEQGLAVYTTSVAVEALIAGGREQDKDAIEHARRFLVAGQFDESKGFELGKDAYYGGVGYGDGERPDLSNSQMAIEAASRAGTPANDPFFVKARSFLEQCQNLSEGEPKSWPRPDGGKLVAGTDGGGTYLPGAGAAGEVRLADGIYQARSYGSMTYALAKSYILCGVPADDGRLSAAIRWLADHFTVENNPGFERPEDGKQGLYYYYLSLGRTLRRLPPEGFRNAKGEPIAWREALTRKLLDSQRTDGSWINEGSVRWFEGAPTLCTAYAVLALVDAGA